MTRLLAPVLCLGLALTLPGCAAFDRFGGGTPNNYSSPALPPPSENQDVQLAALQARMDQLEQDMAEISIEMSRILPMIEAMSGETGSPMPQASVPSTTMPSSSAPARTADVGPSMDTTPPPQPDNSLGQMNRLGSPETAPTMAVNDGADQFAVHLASYRDRESALAGWYELQGRFGPVLNSLEPRLAEVDIEGRGTFYRLKAGPFTNWGGANEVCDYLRGESWSCAVMDYTGAAAE